jgi:formate dehydrogenase subunit delta
MANQIAKFFRSYPEADAIVGVEEHIRAFWTPGMRAALSARIAEAPEGIEHLVVLAMTRPTPPAGESPILKQTEGPAELGQAASDAG